MTSNEEQAAPGAGPVCTQIAPKPNYPEWVRPTLRAGQLEGEDARLAKRDLWPQQVRADLIVAAAKQAGDSRKGRLSNLAPLINCSPGYVENVLSGRLPIGDTLLDGLYGPVPANQLSDTSLPANFGPMLHDALSAGVVNGIAAELVELLGNSEEFNSDADGGFIPVPPPAPVAVEPLTDSAPTASPVVAIANTPEADSATDGADMATPASVFTSSLRLPERSVPGGAAGSPASVRDAAGEGTTRSVEPSPLRTDNSFTRVLAELDAMLAAAIDECANAEAAFVQAEKRVALARLTVRALTDASQSVGFAHERALELLGSPSVQLRRVA